MKVPADLTTTVLRYKLDPGEPGLLKSTTPGKSMQAVTNQELGNLRQFTREAAQDDYDVVSSKIEYKTAIVDGKLSIKAGRTTVYSIPSDRAAEVRYEHDSTRNYLLKMHSNYESKVLDERRASNDNPDANREYSSSETRTHGAEGDPYAFTSGGVEESRRNNATEGEFNNKLTYDPNSPELRESEQRKLDNERTIVEARLAKIRETLELARSAREDNRRPTEAMDRIESSEAMLEKQLEDVNQRIVTLEGRKLIERNDRYVEVARENNDAQLSITQKASSVSAVAGGFSTVI
jgi:hypothetical protein